MRADACLAEDRLRLRRENQLVICGCVDLWLALNISLVHVFQAHIVCIDVKASNILHIRNGNVSQIVRSCAAFSKQVHLDRS